MIETAQSITGYTYGARRTRATSVCASWPTTAGPCPCWWPTGCSRPTRAAATSCAGSSAAPCGGPASWGWTGPSSTDWWTPPWASSDRPIRPWPNSISLVSDVVVPRGGGVPAHIGHRFDHPRRGAGLRGHRWSPATWPSGCTTPTGFRSSSPSRSPRRPGSASIWPPSKRPWTVSGPRPVRRPGPARRVAGEQAYRSVLDAEGQTVFVGQRPDGYSAPARVVAVLARTDADHRR